MNVVVSRKLDDLGRVVLPIEVRQDLDLSQGDIIDICTDNGHVILRKAQAYCIFCNGTENLYEVRGKHICDSCLNTIKDISLPALI